VLRRPDGRPCLLHGYRPAFNPEDNGMRLPPWLAPLAAIIAVSLLAFSVAEAQQNLPTAEEAPGRARLLHETVHATLQVVHHEYYREDENLKIPAASLQMVFRELARRQRVELRWLAVNAQAMNVDHVPRDDFEKQAVKALAGGATEFASQDERFYRYAITLDSSCLKCHAPTRTNNRDRTAALVIKLPLRRP
jgi:hypothetical protein